MDITYNCSLIKLKLIAFNVIKILDFFLKNVTQTSSLESECHTMQCDNDYQPHSFRNILRIFHISCVHTIRRRRTVIRILSTRQSTILCRSLFLAQYHACCRDLLNNKRKPSIDDYHCAACNHISWRKKNFVASLTSKTKAINSGIPHMRFRRNFLFGRGSNLNEKYLPSRGGAVSCQWKIIFN